MELRITKISTMCFVLSCPTLRHHKAIYKRMLQFPGEVQLYAQRVIHRFFSSRVVHQSVYHHILVLFGWYFSITEWYVSFCWVFRCTTRCADHCIWPVAVIADEMTERVIRNIAKSKMIFFFFFFKFSVLLFYFLANSFKNEMKKKVKSINCTIKSCT